MTKQKAKRSPAPKKRVATAAPAELAKTKLGQLEGMLRRKEGATIAQIATALDWQPHSVRGAISGSLKKKQGLTITNESIEGGDRVYRIV
jgi:hypothetical protein